VVVDDQAFIGKIAIIESKEATAVETNRVEVWRDRGRRAC